MLCSVKRGWRQAAAVHFRRVILVDERGLERQCPLDFGRFRSDDLSVGGDEAALIGAEVKSHPRRGDGAGEIWAMVCGLSVGLFLLVNNMLGLGGLWQTVGIAGALGFGAASIGTLLHGHKIATAYAAVLSEVCDRHNRCAFCLYPLVDVPDDADGRRVCPECGGAWTLTDPPALRGPRRVSDRPGRLELR